MDFARYHKPWHPLLILLAAAAFPWSRLLLGQYQINHDVSWFFYLAQGMLNGGRLYVDYIDPNTPFASLSLVPAVAMSRALNLSPGFAVELYVLSIGSVVMLLNAVIVQKSLPGIWGRLFLLASVASIFTFLPQNSFGQREPLAWMLFTPYCLLSARLKNTKSPGIMPGAMAGVLAMLAVSLKPTLALVPFFIEIVLLCQQGWRSAWRATFISLCLSCVICVAIVFFGFPRYWQQVMPWAVAIYGGYSQPQTTLLWSVFCIFIVAWPLILLFWARQQKWRQLAVIALAGFGGALLSYYIQSKAWYYQLIPAYSFLLLLIACVTAGLAPAAFRSLSDWLKLAACGALAGLFYMLLHIPSGSIDKPAELSKLADVVEKISSSTGPFVVFSTSVDPAFPAALIYNKIWASRYPCMLALPHIVQDMARQKTTIWEQNYRADINSDMARYHPTLVMIPTGIIQALPNGFDILGWLLRDPVFARQWRAYVEMPPLNGFRVFQLKS